MADTQTALRLLAHAGQLCTDTRVHAWLAHREQSIQDFTAGKSDLVGIGQIAGLHALDALRQKYGSRPELVCAQVERYRKLLETFAQSYGHGPVTIVAAPARIELCGGHIDYIDYFQDKILASGSRECDMLMAARLRPDRSVRGRSMQQGFGPQEFSLDEFPGTAAADMESWLAYLDVQGCPEPNWINYVKGSAFFLQHLHPDQALRGIDFVVDSTIPVGGGASSSSALVMTSAYALRTANGLPIDPAELAQSGGKAEWFIGTRGGTMDHATMAFGEVNRAVLVTFQPFKVTPIAAPTHGYEWITFYTVAAEKNKELMALDNEISAVSTTILPFLLDRILARDAELKQGWERVLRAIEDEDVAVLQQCQPAISAVLGRLPETLTLEQIETEFPELNAQVHSLYPALREYFDHKQPIAIRAKYRFHLGEISRVLREASALNVASRAQIRGDIEEEAAYMLRLGELLCETHVGLHGDYRVGTPDLDTVADAARAVHGVLGVRTMGFGMGGNVLVLVRESEADTVIDAVQQAYYRPNGRNGLEDGSINRHTPGPGMTEVDPARPARDRLVALVNEWRRWKANEPEILSLALGIVGCDRLEDFAPTCPITPVILAGGKGSRAQLDRPKVLAEIKGKPALHWVLDTIYSIPNVNPAVLVVSNYRDGDQKIKASIDGRYEAELVIETKLHGTGHAVWQACQDAKALQALAPEGSTVLVTEGTQAMMQLDTLRKALLIHEAIGDAAMTMPTAPKERPYAYLVRDERGFVCDSRETRLENAEIIDYGEDNVSVYLVDGPALLPALEHARARSLDAATGEYKLGQLGFPNEMVKSLHQQGKLVLGLCCADEREAQSIKYAEDVLKIEHYLDEFGAKPR